MVVWACLCVGGASENFLLKTRYINSLFDLIDWRSLKLVPFKSLGAVSYSPSIVTLAVSVAVWDIWRQKVVTLKTGLGFVQGHWKWHHLIAYAFLFAFHSKLWLYLQPFRRYPASKNGLTLKCGCGVVVQGHWKRARFNRPCMTFY